MQRAGIFIGVRKTGKLPELKDALASAQRMHAWALGQGMEDGTSAVLVTDERGPVGLDQLTDAVAELIKNSEPDQLIIYFAGHGVTLRSSEQWLLSRAPENASAAVDVRLSADIATSGTVPHVVFVSDACRTAPGGIQAQSVQGGSIFPNDPGNDDAFVDIYFACKLGRPAAEIQDGETSAKTYRAVFTEVLLEALEGKYQEAWVQASGSKKLWYADSRRVRDVLKIQVPKKIRSKRLKARYGQVPRALILSDPGTWLASLDGLPAPPAGAGKGGGAGTSEPESSESESTGAGRDDNNDAPIVIPDRDFDLGPGFERRNIPYREYQDGEDGGWVRPPPRRDPPNRTSPRPAPPGHRPSSGTTRIGPAERALEADIEHTSAGLVTAHGPNDFETGCGLKVRGGTVDRVVAAPGVFTEKAGDQVVRVCLGDLRHASLIVQFNSGEVTVAPLLQDFITSLTLDGGELIAVELEPVTTSPRSADYQRGAPIIRELRARAAAASAYGTFEPASEDFHAIAKHMQSLKALDPALAIYAGYAYYALRQQERIEQMARYLYRDTGARLFDLELLARHLMGRQPLKNEHVLPSMPLLSQGWSLVLSHETRMPAGLGDLGRLAKDSVWSLYRPQAYELLDLAIQRRRIR